MIDIKDFSSVVAVHFLSKFLLSSCFSFQKSTPLSKISEEPNKSIAMFHGACWTFKFSLDNKLYTPFKIRKIGETFFNTKLLMGTLFMDEEKGMWL